MSSFSREGRRIASLRGIWFLLLLVGSASADECTSEVFFTSGDQCTVITGNLVINKDVTLPAIANKITEIKGTLEIKDRTKDIEFSELTKIDTLKSKEPAIIIRNSPKLNLKLPNLKDVKSEGETFIVITGSDGSKFPSFDQLNGLSDDKMKIECTPSRPISGNAQIYCTSIKGDVTFEKFHGSFMLTIGEVSGCLSVIETKFLKLPFIETAEFSSCSGTVKIHNNPDVCWNGKEVAEKTNKFGSIDYVPEENCDITCENDFYKYCNHFVGNLEIKNVQTDADMLRVVGKVKDIKGQLIITGNDDVEIIFAQLTNIDNSNSDGPAILIQGNPNIKNLEFPKPLKVSTQGNTVLSVEDTKLTKDVRSSLYSKFEMPEKRLAFECDLGESAVKDFEELDYCTSVRNDLVLDGTTGVATAVIEKIGGCLKVKNTQLINLDFLDFSKNQIPKKECVTKAHGTSEISGNSKLCLTWFTLSKLKPAIGKIAASDHEHCPFPCTVAEFEEKESLCKQLNGDLNFDAKYSDKNKAKSITEKIVTIKGSLNIIDSPFDEFSFPKLETIENSDICLNINDATNQKLKKLSFPKLKKVKSTSGVDPIHIKAEKLSFITADLGKILIDAANGKKINYECVPASEINDWSQLNWCTRITADLKFSKSVKGNPSSSRIEYISGCLKIENTNLESIFFLNLKEDGGTKCSGGHAITGNKKLCVSTHKEKTFNKKLGTKLTVSNNKEASKCPVTCDTEQGAITDPKCQIVEGSVKIQNNCTGNQFNDVTEIRGNLYISDCKLKSLKTVFPKLKKIYATHGVALWFSNIQEDMDAKQLMELQLESKDDFALYIEKNKQIAYLDAAGLKNVFGSDKVHVEKAERIPQGVCVFTQPTAEIKKDCATVTGDLILDKTIKDAKELKEIKGCLIMKNTNMTDYSFLTTIKVKKDCEWRKAGSDVSDNLCIPYKVRRLLKDKNPLKNSTNDESNSKGCYECSGSLQGNGTMCKVMLDGLTVTNETPLKDLKNVTEVYGRLVIRKTTHKQISFPSLTIIDADGAKGPAFEVTENKDLKTLEVPELKKITSKEATKVKITGNPQLEMDKLTKTLASASKETCSKDKGSACQISAESDEPEEATKAPAEEDSKTALWIGLGVSAVVVVLLAGAGGTVFFLYKKGKIFKKKKDGKEEGKGGKGGKKGGKGGKKNTKSGTKTTTKSVANSVSQEASKADAPKTDAPKTDAAKTDAAKTDDPKADAPKPEAGKPDGGKPEAGKPEGGKPEDGKPEAGKPNFGWKAQNPPEAAPASAPASGNSLPPGVPPGRNIDDALDNDEVYNQGITK